MNIFTAMLHNKINYDATTSKFKHVYYNKMFIIINYISVSLNFGVHLYIYFFFKTRIDNQF